MTYEKLENVAVMAIATAFAFAHVALLVISGAG
jgi:hypothetical protein